MKLTSKLDSSYYIIEFASTCNGFTHRFKHHARDGKLCYNKNTTNKETIMNSRYEGLQKGKKSQIHFALFFIALYFLFSWFLYRQSSSLPFYWFSGIAFGFILQKSRFCFTAGFRDPILTGSVELSKAILLALSLTTLGFFIVNFVSHLQTGQAFSTSYVHPIGLFTVVGGLLFGIGMVIAGGGASGSIR
ncbi:MAG TPA: hypothetical protein DHN33_00210 [Eubacteriaceae bacterium]|nr:hypothetical protein [Eubacteriaceae bacterium]